MPERPRFTVSILGAFLLVATMAAFVAWLAPFLAPHLGRFAPNPVRPGFHLRVVMWALAAGACAASLLAVLRLVFPALQSRIVWLFPGFLSRTRMKKNIVDVLGTVLMIALAVVAFNYLKHGR
jgi:hypothetical protein